MIYLILSVLCSVIIAVIFKIVGSKEINKHAMIAANYSAAVLVSLIGSMKNGKLFLINSRSLQMFFYESTNVFTGKAIFTQEASVIWALIVGITLGASYCLSFMKYQKSILENGMGISSMFLRISVILPMLISIVIWNEYPSGMQSIGILMCFISIIIFNVDFRGNNKSRVNYDLILLLIYGGISQLSAKLYQNYAQVECKEVLTLFIFLAALFTSIIFIIRENKTINKNDIILGIMVGIPNLLSTTFLILALNCINTSIVYMLSSVSSIVIVFAIGLIFFKESISKKDYIGILTAIIAVILLNK